MVKRKMAQMSGRKMVHSVNLNRELISLIKRKKKYVDVA
jgi:hypothetical protein